MLTNRRKLLLFSIKALIAWSILTGLIIYSGETALKPLFPLFKPVIMAVVDGFSPNLQVIREDNGISQVRLSVWVMTNVPVAPGIIIPKGIELTTANHVLHILAPIAVLLSILLVWPVSNWRQKGLLSILGLFVSIVILIATIPIIQVGLLELPFQEQALAANAQHPAPWFMDWMVFCEMGGSLLLALCGVFVCVSLQRRWLPDSSDKLTVSSLTETNHL